MSPSGHNRDKDSFHAFIESRMSDPHAVPMPAAPHVRPESQRDHAEGTPLTTSRQTNIQRDYTALGHTEHATATGRGHATASGAADHTRTSAAPREAGRAWKWAPTPLVSLPASQRGPPRPGGGGIWTTHAWKATPAAPGAMQNRRRPQTWACGSTGSARRSSSPWRAASNGCLLRGPANSEREPAPWQTSPSAIGRGTRPSPP